MLLKSGEDTRKDQEKDLIEELYDTYASRVRSLAMGIMKNSADADDALVEVFIKIIKYKEKFVNIDEKQMTRLIVLFTRSTCIDLYRRREKYQAVHVSATAEDDDGELVENEYPDPCADVWQKVLERDSNARLKQAINSLESPAREMILLKYYGGLKNREIADFFHRKTPTVATTIYRAMQKIRKQLEDESNETSQED